MATSFLKIPEFARGIRFRLSLVYSALFGICLIFLSLFISGEYLQQARDDYDQSLRNFALDLSFFVKLSPDGQSAALTIPDSENTKFFPFVIQNTMVTIRHLDGHILYTNRPRDTIPYEHTVAKRPKYTYRFIDFQLNGEKLRGLNLKAIGTQGQSFIVQVANSAEPLQNQQNRQFLFLVALIPLTILVSALLSTVVAGRALDPIRQLALQMANLLKGGNYQPLPVQHTNDEIEQLTRNFNDLILQMQETLAAQERFVAHASHQLNTPLAIMRGELEVLLSKPRSDEEISRFHRSLQQELTRLTQLVKDMLLVSRVEAGKEHFRFVAVEVDEILGETLERLAPHAKKKNISLRYNIDDVLVDNQDRMTYPGERQLLVCLFENLLENAIKYSPADSRVSVRLGLEAEELLVEVSDEGAGMAQEILENICNPKRFQRGNDVTGVSGSGLGLYLAHKVVEFHNAGMVARPNDPTGTCIRVTFRGRTGA